MQKRTSLLKFRRKNFIFFNYLFSRYGTACRHAHALTLAPAANLSSSRGAAMPPLERAAQPTELSAQDTRRIAFIVAHGAVAYDYEDPEAARQFDRHRNVVSVLC